ncbi:MAG: methyltransferase domain-containing protein [Halioglobus sp.]
MRAARAVLEQTLGRPIANVSFAMMRSYIRSAQRRGVDMMHTARPFSLYRKVFYNGESEQAILTRLEGKRIVDIGCGYTPYAEDSMFRACHQSGIEFYGVDPIIGEDIAFGFRERALARATGGKGVFSSNPPGIEKALATTAQDLPFENDSVDEILCSFLLFVWIRDEAVLADILSEFLRVLKPGSKAKLYPLYDWRFMRAKNERLQQVLAKFHLEQSFIHGRGDLRVMPSMLTEMTKC